MCILCSRNMAQFSLSGTLRLEPETGRHSKKEDVFLNQQAGARYMAYMVRGAHHTIGWYICVPYMVRGFPVIQAQALNQWNG